MGKEQRDESEEGKKQIWEGKSRGKEETSLGYRNADERHGNGSNI